MRLCWEGAPEVGFVFMEVTWRIFCTCGIAITASAQSHLDGPPDGAHVCEGWRAVLKR